MKEWQKVLYLHQPYPDNYVEPAKFLDGLRKNAFHAVFTRTYGWAELVWASGSVVQEFSCVCLFVCLYWFVQEGWLSPVTLLAVSTSSSLLATLFLSLTLNSTFRLNISEVFSWVQPSLLFTLFLCGVSPILYTLTETISTDTIWAMTAGMLAAHLLFHNYGSEGAVVSSAISLNASVFASVCLASRLSSALDAFVMVALAVQLFAFFPEFRGQLRSHRPITSPLFTLLLVACATPMIAMVTYTGVTFYLMCVVSLSFLCPFWLYQLQHMKNNIYGPWDEATIQH